MAEKASSTVSKCNFVAQDEIWKDHVHSEVSAAKVWSNNWDFMTTPYRHLVIDEFPLKEKKEKVIPDHLKLPPISPPEKYVTVYPSPKPVPNTTTKVIGWRSSQRKYALERFGSFAKPKGGLIAKLGWPYEAIG